MTLDKRQTRGTHTPSTHDSRCSRHRASAVWYSVTTDLLCRRLFYKKKTFNNSRYIWIHMYISLSTYHVPHTACLRNIGQISIHQISIYMQSRCIYICKQLYTYVYGNRYIYMPANIYIYICKAVLDQTRVTLVYAMPANWRLSLVLWPG